MRTTLPWRRLFTANCGPLTRNSSERRDQLLSVRWIGKFVTLGQRVRVSMSRLFNDLESAPELARSVRRL